MRPFVFGRKKICMKNVMGRLHSTESFGAVDGPGVRFVVFMQGCPLRCLYCHNPDTWSTTDGKERSTEDVLKEILSYKSFIQRGGVTISGGEPLLQAEFCEELLHGCRENGLHTAIDTAGAIPLTQTAKAIEAADLILLDIKDVDDEDCKILSGVSNKHTNETLDFCEKIGKDVWIRHVLLPEYTLKEDKLHRLGAFLKPYRCIKKVELLPYHKLGLYKWETLKIPSLITHIEPPLADEVKRAKEIIAGYGLPM